MPPEPPAPAKEPASPEKQLEKRLVKRFARHENDKLMLWLKEASRRILKARLDRMDD